MHVPYWLTGRPHRDFDVDLASCEGLSMGLLSFGFASEGEEILTFDLRRWGPRLQICTKIRETRSDCLSAETSHNLCPEEINGH